MRNSHKVLIIGPNYYNYLNAVKSAFGRLGWDTLIDSYDNPIHPYTVVMKYRYKLSRDRDKLQKASRKSYNESIQAVFDSYRPDLVFIMNGEILETVTLDYFRKTAKVALWMFDNLNKLPSAVHHIDHVDALFCYDQQDVDYYRLEGKTTFFLPQACDTDIYRPLNLERDIDILFIGNLYHSPKRMSVCNTVIENFPDKKICIYGLYKPWYKGFFKWLTREHRDVYKNCNVSPTEANELYNRSKIVLNIHQEEQKNGANPRVFEICGSGSYQLCDWNPYIGHLFPNGEIGIWHSTEELISLIHQSLDNGCKADTASALRMVNEFHSFDRRIREVIKVLKID